MSNQKSGLDPYYQLVQKDKIAKELDSFEDEFRVRTYYEKYRSIARASGRASYGFNALSIASGSLGMATLFAMFIIPNIYIMLIPAIMILGLIEYWGKRTLLKNWAREKLKNGKTNAKLTIALAFMIILSMIATVGGGIELVNMIRGKAKPQLTNTKNIESKYNAKINEKKALQREIKERNTYKGKTYLPKDERVLNAKYDADIRQLEKDQKVAIAKAKAYNKQKLSDHYQGTQGYIIGFVLLSLFIEGMCVLTIYFPLHFKYKSKEDRKLIISSYKAPQIQPNVLLGLMNQLGVDFTTLVNNMQTTPLQFASTPTPSPVASGQPTVKPKPKNPNSKPIGFTSEDTHPPKEPMKEKRRERGTTKNYELINRLLLEGQKTTHQIAMAANCSDTTVRNAKRKLREAGLLNEEN